MSVCARYLSGDEVRLSFASPKISVNDVCVRIATMHSKFATDVLVMTTHGDLLDADADAPVSVVLVLKDALYTPDIVQQALIRHAKALDGSGVQRITSTLRPVMPNIDIGNVSALAILRYLRSIELHPAPLPDNCENVLRTLLSDSVDLTLGDMNGRTSIHCAAARGFDTLLDILLTHDPSAVDTNNTDCSTALDSACYTGHYHCVEVLLKWSASVSLRDRGGRTALDCAAAQGHTRIVELLMANRAEVNNRDSDGWTALSEASAAGHAECVRLLVAMGADASSADENGWTALCWAASRGHAEVCDILVQNAQANVRHESKSGWTPILLAASKNHQEVARILGA